MVNGQGNKPPIHQQQQGIRLNLNDHPSFKCKCGNIYFLLMEELKVVSRIIVPPDGVTARIGTRILCLGCGTVFEINPMNNAIGKLVDKATMGVSPVSAKIEVDVEAERKKSFSAVRKFPSNVETTPKTGDVLESDERGDDEDDDRS